MDQAINKVPVSDKEVERQRFEQLAATALKTQEPQLCLGSAGMPLVLRRPYLRFEELLGQAVSPGAEVLDICCGDGQFSFYPAQMGARVTGLDLSRNSLLLAEKRCPEEVSARVRWREGDCEELPFEDGAFSGAICAGGLSYGDWEKVLGELKRVLRPGGWFIAVDSFNHSPVYRLNRWRHWLRGRRTATVNRRIPSRKWLDLAGGYFAGLSVEHFGVFSFMAPILQPLAGEVRTARWLNDCDEWSGVPKSWAFKVVVKAET